jgi:hypothetical protein
MKYAMLIFGDDREWTALSPEDEQDMMKQVYGWFERWQPTGKSPMAAPSCSPGTAQGQCAPARTASTKGPEIPATTA